MTEIIITALVVVGFIIAGVMSRIHHAAEDELEWIHKIWERPKPVLWQDMVIPHPRLPLFLRLRAIAAILLDRVDEKLADYDAPDVTEVAHLYRGTYMTDYGEGHAFEVLVLKGLSYATYSDGTL